MARAFCLDYSRNHPLLLSWIYRLEFSAGTRNAHPDAKRHADEFNHRYADCASNYYARDYYRHNYANLNGNRHCHAHLNAHHYLHAFSTQYEHLHAYAHCDGDINLHAHCHRHADSLGNFNYSAERYAHRNQPARHAHAK